MITKATIQMPGTLSWERIENPNIHGHNITDAASDLQRLTKELENCRGTLSFMEQFPDHSIQMAVAANFGRLATVREYTKKRRTYSISYLTITEED